VSKPRRAGPEVIADVVPASRPGEFSDPRAFAAIGNRVRMAILSQLSAQEKSVAELTEALGLHRLTVRYHLAFLLQNGLVEEVAPTKHGQVGRPAALYRASRQARLPGFPPRHYEVLAQVTLKALVDEIGTEGAVERLEAQGRAFGKRMIEQVHDEKKVRRWTPETFREAVLQGLFKEFGVESQVLGETKDALHYRSFTCPFLEMAQQMPGLVCDALDSGMHRGIDDALGVVTTERRACMGHGDPFCEYQLRWRAPRTARRSGERAKAGNDDEEEGEGRGAVPRAH